MSYRYKRNQIFRKKPDVPAEILNKIYAKRLTFQEYVRYDLEDKIPITCLGSFYQEITNKFGIQKAKVLDWELIDSQRYYIDSKIKELDANTENINEELYTVVMDKIRPNEYTFMMQKAYPERILNDPNVPEELRNSFNRGSLELLEIIQNWQFLKEKNLSKSLQKDYYNTNGVTDAQLKQFMNDYSELLNLIDKTSEIYNLISKIYTNENNEEERKKIVVDFVNEVLEKTITTSYYDAKIDLSDAQYNSAFKHVSMREYLSRKLGGYNAEELLYGLNGKSDDHLLRLQIPFSILLESDVNRFITIYGIDNVVNFDNECGHFFTNNNYEMLRLMSDMYLHYAGNERNPEKTIFTRNDYDEQGNYVKRPYTKEEFYESMRRMIVYGPSDWNYVSKAADYRAITGPFRELNPDLFVAENLPESFQKAFYTKSLTPQMIGQNPDFIPFLQGKDLSSCFKQLSVEIMPNYKYSNVYKLLLDKAGFDKTVEIIKNYADVLETVFHSYDPLKKISSIKSISFDDTDDIEMIKNKINNKLFELIIKTDIKYGPNLPQSIKEKHPELFISDNTPRELQEKFYNREIDADFIAKHPEYIEYLREIDIEVIFKHIPVKVEISIQNNANGNLIGYIKKLFNNEAGLDILLLYGKYLDIISNNKGFDNVIFDSNMTKEEVLSKLESLIYLSITKGESIYDDKMPQHFKEKYPFLFLPPDTPIEVREKFYSRSFTSKDFYDNPDILKYFENTDVACSLDPGFSWMIGLFNNGDDFNGKKIKILAAYTKINDSSLQSIFKNYILNNIDSIKFDKIDLMTDLLYKLSYSNSSEMLIFRTQLANQLLLSNNPLDNLNKIEDIFLRNNIPTVGKIFSVFQILHPNCNGFDFSGSSMMSPVLKSKSTTGKEITIFSDLLKLTLGSNNRAIRDYLENIEKGNQLLLQMSFSSINFDQLDDKNRNVLSTFLAHLNTLYNNTMTGKKEENTRMLSGNITQDINELIRLFSTNGSLDYDLPDRIIKMFCHFAGFDTFEQAKGYFIQKPNLADAKNRKSSGLNFTLERGDFIKGIGSIKYLQNILQNGSVAREFLGSSAGSDLTPLDTDLSRIIDASNSVSEAIRNTEASSYGPIWFVLKDDDRFTITRKSSHETDQIIDTNPDVNKLEVFYTGAAGNKHYGIRTGFASSEIDYIITEAYDPKIGLELAMNGFYIPVVDKTSEKLVFSPQNYDEIRSKMSGLTHFGTDKYSFAESLSLPVIEELSNQIQDSELEVLSKRNAINTVISKSIANNGLRLKTIIDGDLTEGSVELIDTGSTGRGTNMPGDGDFDFMMRLDKKQMTNPEKLRELKESLLKALGKDSTNEVTGGGDFRLKGVSIEALDVSVDIDITFVEKTDKLTYSTERALEDRLKSIREQSPEQYSLVVANILLAKQTLKDAGVYKPNRGEVPQGGLGGVGVENWILQNGGSFEKATIEFLNASKDKTFEEFKKSYSIWDFGENHLASKKGIYPHDNFVENNMSEQGYLKMKEVLTNYLNKTQHHQLNAVHR